MKWMKKMMKMPKMPMVKGKMVKSDTGHRKVSKPTMKMKGKWY